MKYAFVVIACTVALIAVAGARAANWPDPRLDTAASQVAGHPVQVWCEDSVSYWVHVGDSIGVDFGTVQGFTVPSQSTTVYITPQICRTLHALLGSGPNEVGNYWGSLAVHVLVHEAEHQAGHVDEGETDCAALTQDDAIAVAFFGYHNYDQIPTLVDVPHKATFKGHVYRWKTTAIVMKVVPSVQLQDFHDWDHAWHSVAPPAYQGGCK